MTETSRTTRLVALAIALVPFFLSTPLGAQTIDRCHEDSRSRRPSYCEERTYRLRATTSLDVDATNGGITVTGWDRNEISVVARVRATAASEADARELAAQIEVIARNGRVRADGPRAGRGRSWSVSYDVRVPHATDLRLESTNGGLGVSDVVGTLGLRTTNGGIRLARVDGDVRGRTTNGGIDVQLEGDGWRGSGLELETTNGGVTLALSEGYSARVVGRTTNGGIATDFPLTVQGRIGRRLEGDLGRGGSPIRVTTTNGGIRLQRR